MSLNLNLQSKSVKKRIIYIVCSVLLVNYLIFQYYFISPLPFGDDLPSIYQFLLKLNSTDSYLEKIDLILNNKFVEHKLLFFTFIISTIFSITGKIYLPLIALIAGITWVSIFFFYRSWGKTISASWLLIITFILVSAAPYQTIYWTMAGLQHFTVTFLCFVTIYFLCKSDKITIYTFIGASLAGLFCTFSSGNGMAIWPAGLLALLLRKNYKLSLVWTVNTIIAISLYLQSVALQGTPSGSRISNVFDHLPIKIINYITGLAGAFYFDKGVMDLSDSEPPISFTYPSTYIGLLIIIFFIILLVKAFQTANRSVIAVTAVSVFIFITFGFIAFGRSSEAELFVIFKSRYYPYSIIAIANLLFGIGYVMNHFRYRQLLTYIFAGGSLIFWGIWQFGTYANVLNQRNLLDTGYLNFKLNKQWIFYQPTYFFERYYNDFFTVNESNPTVELPHRKILTAFQNKKITTQGFHPYEIIYKQEISGDVYTMVNAYNGNTPSIYQKDEGYTLLMASRQDTFFLQSTFFRNSVKQFLLTGNPIRRGHQVSVILKKHDFPKGTYQLHQFYFKKELGKLNPKSEGTITF